MKKRVVVAMSGGVDSSVAAALLKEQGFEVIGITMCFSLADAIGKRPGCCGIQGIEDARRVAQKLGIRHYVLNMQKALEEHVIKDFLKEYSCGRTPNPCIRCNQYLKFGALLKKALSLDADFLATGHYARIKRSHQVTRSPGHQYYLGKARDLKKDQSYFLYRVNQAQLKRLLFPLGDFTKEQVRAMAREFKLSVADKLGSQEICFLPDTDYRAFMKKNKNAGMKPGPIRDKQGNLLGQHQGIAFYTIGQREGLGIAQGHPIYINRIETKTNTITVGRRDEALGRMFLARSAHFIVKPTKKKIAAKVKIRYNHREEPACVHFLENNRIRVCFKEPQFAVTPGQAAVFYDRDTVLGGGIIEKVLDDAD